ncbi:hypothetical protein [Lichenicoccus sp.]|uniref:hypothetical protein n=1 Tax=Lichenicoccus sp. TaxID=2781899 RepID=UPI003D12EF5C
MILVASSGRLILGTHRPTLGEDVQRQKDRDEFDALISQAISQPLFLFHKTRLSKVHQAGIKAAWGGIIAAAAERASLERSVPQFPQIIEVIQLCGFYLTISYLVGCFELPLEHFSRRFNCLPPC